jgi:hypothetical protein
MAIAWQSFIDVDKVGIVPLEDLAKYGYKHAIAIFGQVHVKCVYSYMYTYTSNNLLFTLTFVMDLAGHVHVKQLLVHTHICRGPGWTGTRQTTPCSHPHLTWTWLCVSMKFAKKSTHFQSKMIMMRAVITL